MCNLYSLITNQTAIRIVLAFALVAAVATTASAAEDLALTEARKILALLREDPEAVVDSGQLQACEYERGLWQATLPETIAREQFGSKLHAALRPKAPPQADDLAELFGTHERGSVAFCYEQDRQKSDEKIVDTFQQSGGNYMLIKHGALSFPISPLPTTRPLSSCSIIARFGRVVPMVL